MGLEFISNLGILRFTTLGKFVKFKFMILCNLSKQGILILITQLKFKCQNPAIQTHFFLIKILR